MGTRFYLRFSEAAAVSPSFGVGAPDFDWSSSTSATRCRAATTKLSGDTPTTQGPRSVTNNTNLIFVQGVTDPMPTGTAFTTSTLIKAQFQVSESAGDDNIFPNLHLKVVSEDGSTLRQELRTATDTTGVEFGTTLQNRAFATAGASDFLGLGYTTVAGDRLCIGIGAAAQAGVSPSCSIRFGSDGDDLAELGAETGSTFVGWVEFTNLDIFAPPAFSGWTPHTRDKVTPEFTVDGVPIPVVNWQADVDADWGDRTLTGAIPKNYLGAEELAPIVCWRRSDDAMWSGTIVSAPRLEGDYWQIRAEGPAADMERNRERGFYRIDGFNIWSDKEEDPYQGTNNDKYDLTARPGLLRWKQDPSDAFSTNDQAGFTAWVEGGLITKYSFKVVTGGSYGAFDLETQRYTGPTGTKTAINTHGLNPVSSPITGTMADPEDAIVLRMIANTNAGAGTRRVVTALEGKLYGRTTDDDFSISQVARDVANLNGLSSLLVQGNGQRALPLDWTEDHPSLMTYLAEQADWYWMARRDGLTFAPWEETWEAFSTGDGTPSLQPEPRYNRFRVPYRTLSGALREAEAEPALDPFPGRERVLWAEELEDPQPDSTVADAYAAARVEYEASIKLAGSFELARIRFLGEPRDPYDARPGILLAMPDLGPDVPAQRVNSVSYAPEHQVTLQIGNGFNVVKGLADAERQRRRKKKRRKA